MHRTLTFFDFCDTFRALGRNDSFSYEAKRILYDYLEQLEKDLGESIELDVVALCCDYNEMSWREVADNYRIDVGPDMSDDECIDAVRNYLERNTQVCGEFDEPLGIERGGPVFVFQTF